MKYTKTITSQRLVLVKEEIDFYCPKVESSQIAYGFLKKQFKPETIELFEEFHIMLLSMSNMVIGHSKIATGGYTGVIADLKMIFSIALKNTNANGIILCHNHPSGKKIPSEADIQLTQRAVEFGKMIELPILDHIIVTADGYYSFADNGKI